MAVKTITIDLEAYELLAKARRSSESFSKVIKQVLGPENKNAHSLLKQLESIKVSNEFLDNLENTLAARTDDMIVAESE